jgi:hypothetical protein
MPSTHLQRLLFTTENIYTVAFWVMYLVFLCVIFLCTISLISQRIILDNLKYQNELQFPFYLLLIIYLLELKLALELMYEIN